MLNADDPMMSKIQPVICVVITAATVGFYTSVHRTVANGPCCSNGACSSYNVVKTREHLVIVLDSNSDQKILTPITNEPSWLRLVYRSH